MNVLLLLVPISAVLLGIAIWAFAWAVRNGQFDDLDTPPLRALIDAEGRAPDARGASDADA
jgi:cbb3-type cytochrome oxidase maturation protein